ncbi:MAG: 16S rRNA (guanine(966)-N(2))-methyltransferase RsmD [Fibrobacteraceae bacterium]|jgi:16S rRNA (guanine966-N2)-methyltransferase|nr:16S rRNA (guanine(966)-N(2))-methyltransferase RsmD [Fibrobacteraceae bacterium]
MGIRVTGGLFRGRVINSPEGLLVRPTGARTREAVFNILQDVSGFSVLDLFAGSGIMGIEALSRGASSVVAVENNRAQALAIKTNYRHLQIEKSLTLLEKDALTLDSVLASYQFDLIYADPPFVKEYPDLRKFLDFLSPDGVAIFECPSRAIPEWALEGKVRRYGESSLAFFWKDS